MINKHFIYLFIGIFLIASCKDKEKTGLEKYVNNYISNNDSVIMVMKIDLKQIMADADIQQLPDIGFELVETIKSVDSAVGLDEKVYLIGEGPINLDGMPNKTSLFLAVQDEQRLTNMFSDMGYFFEENGTNKIHEENGLGLLYNSELLIISLPNFNSNAKQIVETIYEKSTTSIEKENSNAKMLDFLSDDADVMLSMNLSNLYGTSNTDIEDLPIEIQDKVRSLTANSYVNYALNFSEGEISLAMDMAFNEELEEMMFLADEGNSEVLSKLGSGTPIMAGAINLNVEKMEKMMLDFYPQAMDEIYSNLGPEGMIVKTIGGSKLSNFTNGDFAFAINGIDGQNFGGMIPEFSIYSGLGASSTEMQEFIVSFMEGMGMNEVGIGLYEMEGIKLKFDDNSLMASTVKNISGKELGSSSISLPEGLEDFGKKPISFYIDFSNISAQNIEMMADDASIAVNEIRYIFFEGDNNGSKLVIKLKDDSVNVLKKAIDVTLKSFMPSI